ncbi:MAG: SUMF1/EgtB/PvdO family nonheme iron enzyme [Planctomycetota bacterium]
MDALRKERWHNMLVAALSDGALGEEEKAYLAKIRAELGITDEEAKETAAEIKKSGASVQLKGSREDRLTMLRDMIGVALADGVIAPQERRMLELVADRLDLLGKDLRALMNEVRAAQAEPPAPPTVSPLPNSVIHAKTGIELLRIPAAVFAYGSSAVGVVEREARVEEYLIGRFAVTNEEWLKFEKETRYQGRADFGRRFNGPRQPVVGVSLDDALAFSAWAGLRLPTEREWEYAARGKDERPYPWGKSFPNRDICNYARNLFDEKSPATLPVGSFPHGASPAGCEDMAGNVAEWCLPDGAANIPRYPVRGGHWLSAAYALNAFYHEHCDRGTRNNRIGFRACASPQAV